MQTQPQNVPAAKTIESLKTQLHDSMAQAHQLSEQLEAAKERVKLFSSALNGVELGQRAAQESADEGADSSAPE